MERLIQKAVAKIQKKKVVQISDKVLTSLFLDNELSAETTGAARAVVKITQEQLTSSFSDNLNLNEIKETAKALADGLQCPAIQSSNLYPQAIQAMPVLKDIYDKKTAIAKNNQLQPGEVRIDEKTTLILPNPLRSLDMEVPRRAFLIGLKNTVSSVGLSTLSIGGLGVYGTKTAGVRGDQLHKQAKEKFDQVHPTKDIDFSSKQTIEESDRYNKEREQQWSQIEKELSKRYPTSDDFLIAGLLAGFAVWAVRFVGRVCWVTAMDNTDRNPFTLNDRWSDNDPYPLEFLKYL